MKLLKYKHFIFLIIITFLSVFPLLHKGLHPTHDGEYHIIRFHQFYKTLLDGNLYPRWAPDLNNTYGVPLFNYVYPLPNYFASFLHLFGISFIDSFKLNLFFASFVGAIFFYLWAKEFWGIRGGVVSSILYTYSPYHFLDIYIRGSVGEVWSLAVFPGLLWATTRVMKKNSSIFIPISAIFLALLIFSHNILALLFFIFWILYFLILLVDSDKKKHKVMKLLTIATLGISLSAIFWMPALFEKKFVKGLEIYNISENFPEFYQLIFPSWGSGFSGTGVHNQMSFQIGITNLLVIIVSFLLLLIRWKRFIQRRIWLFMLGCFFAFSFLILKSSSIIWTSFPFLNYFQFPWRILSLVIIFPAFLAGGIVAINKLKLFAFLLICSSVVSTIGYTTPAYYHNRDDSYYLSRNNFIYGTNSPGNLFNTIWFPSKMDKPKEKINYAENSVRVTDKKINTTNYSFVVDSNKKQTIVINTAFFPGWESFIDNKKERVLNKNGIIEIEVPSGNHTVEVKFGDTNIRRLSKSLSLISFLGIVFFIFQSYNKKRI